MCEQSFDSVSLEKVVDILDHLRVPINAIERFDRAGSVPYYGANGLQGWIDRPLFDEPLILVAEDGGNFDDFATRPIAYRIEGPSWVNNHAHIIRAKCGISQSFLFWSLVHKDIRRYIAGGTRTKLTQGELRRVYINLPHATEQQIIAQILDTLDTAIHETEAIIEKLKAVKQGLLHDLLTRGIDANGGLRPPQSEAPHLYKNSPLGWIPNEWDTFTLGSVTNWASGGTPDRGVASFWHGKIPFLAPKDMKKFLLQETSEFITSKALQAGSKLMPPNSVFIVVRGMILAHSFPVVLSDRPMAFNQDIKAITSGPNLNGRFLAHWFVANSPQFLRRVTEATHGTKKLDLKDLLSMPIAVPSIEEQTLVVERQESLDDRIEQERASLIKLQKQKSGLMDDLLTGRVRVTPLLK